MTFSVIDGIAIDSNRNVRLGRLNTDPGSVAAGTIHFNTGLGVARGWNGTQWVSLTQGAGTTQAWGWGRNQYGQLGVNSTTDQSSPVSVVGGFTDWVQISVGVDHTAAIRANGTAWTWGRNGYGRLGDNTATNRSSPVSVVGGFTDWVQIAGGTFHTVALRANGTAWAWGSNSAGQLGDFTNTSRSSPVSVAGGFTDWLQISAGGLGAAAIKANGTAWSWGLNNVGQLGDGTTSSRLSPVPVAGDITNWTQISVGNGHTVAIRANGTAWSWGFNNSGRLGDNTTTNRSSPVSVVGGITDWVQVSAGVNHSAAIRANGTSWGWGNNVVGALGSGNTTYQSSPVSVVGGFTDWVQISAGDSHTAAIRANGTAWAWGSNLNFRLGFGGNQFQFYTSPKSVIGGFTDWIQISANTQRTQAIRATII